MANSSLNLPNLQRPEPERISAHDLAEQLGSRRVAVIDVREPMEFVGGHIAGSLNVPLSRLAQADLPQGALVLVCQSGNRSAKGVQTQGSLEVMQSSAPELVLASPAAPVTP